MGFLYLLAAVVGSSSLVIILKVFGIRGVNMNVGITMNYIVGAALSFLLAPTRMTAGDIMQLPWVWVALLTGIVFMLALVVYGISAQRSGVAITTISGRAAVVIPVVFAFVIGEKPTFLKVAMLALILFAMMLILRKREGGGQGGTVAGNRWLILLPLLVFLTNGISDTLVQYAQRERLPAGDNDIYYIFNGVLFAGGAVTGLIVYALECIRKGKWRNPTGKDIALGSALGVMNWICMIGVMYSLVEFDASVFYPLYYTGAIVLSTVVGVLVFRERLSAVNWAGIGIAVAAIAVLSTL